MKVTKQHLKKIILEEVKKELNENLFLKLFGIGRKAKTMAGMYKDSMDYFAGKTNEVPEIAGSPAEAIYTLAKAAIEYRSKAPERQIIRGRKTGCLYSPKVKGAQSYRFLCKGGCPNWDNPEEAAEALKHRCVPQK